MTQVMDKTTSYRTSIRRNKPSAPVKALEQLDLFGTFVLDYGCGRGDDLEYLDGLDYYVDGYDPNPALNRTEVPKPPLNGYDTVLCTYVLNVVTEEVQEEILAHIRELLSPDGEAYITVRRGLKCGSTTQRVVKLDLPVALEKKGAFVTYSMTKWS